MKIQPPRKHGQHHRHDHRKLDCRVAALVAAEPRGRPSQSNQPSGLRELHEFHRHWGRNAAVAANSRLLLVLPRPTFAML